MKLLIIDDSTTTRYVIVKLLRELGYRDITAVGSAEDGLKTLADKQFDCILLDWNLPQMSGLEFLKTVRADRATDKIPIVMVTTVNEKNSVLQALKIGLQGYIFKPVVRETLAAKLAEIASRYGNSDVKKS